MPVYDLTISPDYVRDWSPADGIRELLQNAIDHGEFDWDFDRGSLIITSYGVQLGANTLLLGQGTKREDGSKIGQFGEGYKLAMLTLLRDGHNVEINNGMHETWRPRIKKSKIYASDILCIEVSNRLHDSSDLVFTIDNVSPELENEVIDNTLFMQQKGRSIHVPDYGDILTNEEQCGKVYVGGLFVTKTNLKYGYDIHPKHLKLDRDRKMVRAFDLQWLTSRMWMAVSKEKTQLLVKLIEQDVPDVQYANNHSWGSQHMKDAAWSHFAAAHPGSFPVSGQSEVERLKKIIPGVKVVVVNDNRAQILSESRGYREQKKEQSLNEEIPVVNPKQSMLAFFSDWREEMPQKMRDDFNELLKMSNYWKDNR